MSTYRMVALVGVLLWGVHAHAAQVLAAQASTRTEPSGADDYCAGMNVPATPSAVTEAPEKGFFTFTFDDSYRNQIDLAFPLLKANNLRATSYVVTNPIGQPTDEPTFESMTWAQLKELDLAGWEIGAHTASHMPLASQDPSQQISSWQLKDELETPIELIEQNLGKWPVTFATPLGAFDDRAMDAIKKCHQSHVEAWGGVDKVTGFNPTTSIDPYHIYRFTWMRGTSTRHICNTINRAAADHYWYVVLFHGVSKTPVEGDKGKFFITLDELTQVVSCAVRAQKERGLAILPVSEALAQIPHKTSSATAPTN